MHEHLVLAARRGRGLRRDALRRRRRPGFYVRPFECLGACDIAPMASVDGEYVGPLELRRLRADRDDVKAGREVLPDKQLKRRKIAVEHWRET